MIPEVCASRCREFLEARRVWLNMNDGDFWLESVDDAYSEAEERAVAAILDLYQLPLPRVEQRAWPHPAVRLGGTILAVACDSDTLVLLHVAVIEEASIIDLDREEQPR